MAIETSHNSSFWLLVKIRKTGNSALTVHMYELADAKVAAPSLGPHVPSVVRAQLFPFWSYVLCSLKHLTLSPLSEHPLNFF